MDTIFKLFTACSYQKKIYSTKIFLSSKNIQEKPSEWYGFLIIKPDNAVWVTVQYLGSTYYGKALNPFFVEAALAIC